MARFPIRPARRSPSFLGLGSLFRLQAGLFSLWMAGLLIACASVEEQTQRQVDHHVLLGDAALARGESELASRAYRSALAQQPDLAPALLGLARAARSMGDDEQAVALYDQLASAPFPSAAPSEAQDHAHAQLQATVQVERCGALTDGVRRQLELAVLEPSPPPGAQAGNEVEDTRVGRPAVATARAGFDRLSSDDCAEAENRELMAALLLLEASHARDAQQLATAADLYRRAAAADPDQIEAHIAGAELLVADGRRREALELLSEALESHPQVKELRLRMIELLSQPE